MPAHGTRPAVRRRALTEPPAPSSGCACARVVGLRVCGPSTSEPPSAPASRIWLALAFIAGSRRPRYRLNSQADRSPTLHVVRFWSPMRGEHLRAEHQKVRRE